MPIKRGMDKEDVVHIHNGILLSHKKEQNNAVCNNMDGTRDYHTKWSKSDREIQISHYISYLWNVKHGTNEPICEMETDSQTERTDYGCQGGGEVGGFEVSRSNLVHIEWIYTKVPLCSTGNYIQYFEINHNGKEYFKKRMCINIYIHIYLNHCYTAKINTL